jgi:elongation factor G
VFFVNAISQGTVPKEYIPAVEDAFRDMTKKGQKYPFQFVDVEAELHFGKYHDVDSSQDSFYMCGQEGFRDAERQCGIQLLEPIMKVVAISPKQYQGAISGDINRRRGIIEESSEDKGVSQVMAKIPLAELFGYTSDLRSATGGTASFSMEFSHYAPVREELADLPKVEKK